MTIPSALLHRYFSLASRHLQDLIKDPPQDEMPSPSEIKLDWHRNRIIQTQMSSLDEALLDWKDVSREDVQAALRQIGEGDYSGVSWDVNPDDFKEELTGLMDETNDLARQAYSCLVIFVEWHFDHQSNQPSRSMRGQEDELDKSSVLEYCALAISAVRLESVQKFLENGQDLFPMKMNNISAELDSVEHRLAYVQNLIWRALGWDPDFASGQLQQFFSEENNKCDFVKSLMTDEAVAETLTKYVSSMTVAISNATPLPNVDDGTTRVVNVSYSEKIITMPQHINEGDTTIASLSAPASQSIHEHASVQQRQQLDIAQKTSMLQQQIWDEFQSLPSSEQAKTLERAEIVQREFLEKVMNTPPGPERVLLMQNMSGEDQRLLVVHKLWIGHNSV